jgi:hypothetical protein
MPVDLQRENESTAKTTFVVVFRIRRVESSLSGNSYNLIADLDKTLFLFLSSSSSSVFKVKKAVSDAENIADNSSNIDMAKIIPAELLSRV